MTICTQCARWGHTASRCPLNRKRWAVAGATLVAAALSSCGTTGWIAPDPPSKRLMAVPPPIPPVKVGDDLVIDNLKLRKQLSERNGQVRSLQGYILVSRGEKTK